MSEWRHFRLGDGLTIKHGFAFKSEYFTDWSEFIVLTPGNFHDAGGFKSKSGAEKYYDGPVPNGYVLEAGDVVVAMTEQAHGLLGSTATIPVGRRYLHNQRIGLLRVSDPEALDLRFVYHLFNSPPVRMQLQATATGSKVRHTAPERIANVEVPVPPVMTQRRIAAVLDALEDLIENSQWRLALLEQMTRTIYREWFVHFRFPGHETTALVNSEIGPLPSGWRVQALAGVCERITDGAHRSPPSVASGLPMASVKDMHNWGFNLESCRLIGEEDFHELVRQNCRPRRGDVLVAKDGSYLKHVTVVDRELDVVVLSSIAILRPNGEIDPHILANCLRQPETVGRLLGLVSGVAIPRIVLKDFRTFPVLVPPSSLQSQWSKRVQPMIESCRKLVGSTDQLIRLRDLLLPKLVSGAIDVSKLDVDGLIDEAAA